MPTVRKSTRDPARRGSEEFIHTLRGARKRAKNVFIAEPFGARLLSFSVLVDDESSASEIVHELGPVAQANGFVINVGFHNTEMQYRYIWFERMVV